MKKIGVLILSIALAQFVYAQSSFYSGALVFSANYGVDGNVTNQHYFNPSENSAQTLNGMTSASNFNITGECGVFNWLGLGLIGRFNDYYMQSNEVTKTSPSAGSVDMGGTVNLHIIRFSHLDVLGGYDWGVSQITYHDNDGVNTTSYGNGTWSDFHITGRLYAKRLGVNLNLYAPTMNFSNIQSSNTPTGEYILNYWKSSGYGASIGLQYRLL